jgi:hypothetical protein
VALNGNGPARDADPRIPVVLSSVNPLASEGRLENRLLSEALTGDESET